MLTYAINLKMNTFYAIIAARNMIYHCVIRVQQTSVARVSVFPHNWAILKRQLREKLETLVAFFWATFVMYRGRQNCVYRQIN